VIKINEGFKPMKSYQTALTSAAALFATFATSTAFASATNPLPGPGIFALLALGVVGAIGIAKLRK
jgi:hypothetical protein